MEIVRTNGKIYIRRPNVKDVAVSQQAESVFATNDRVAMEVQVALGHQFAKWGDQDNTPLEWHIVTSEEVGEVSKALTETHFYVKKHPELTDEQKSVIVSKCEETQAEIVQTIACYIQLYHGIEVKKIAHSQGGQNE